MSKSSNKLEAAVLTIAGSDSCGGAGVQADLKTFHALGVYGSSVITAITAQNTLAVHAAEAVSPDLIAAQLNAVLDDLPIRAIKTGMLADAATVRVVSDIISCRCQNIPLIVDPVLVATSGNALTLEDTITALREDLIPLATLVTPNLEETRALAANESSAKAAAREILSLGCRAVLLKGGHYQDQHLEDWLITPREEIAFPHPRLAGEYHGTGCTLSAAIAAFMASGLDLNRSVSDGIEHVQEKLQAARLPKAGSLHLLD